MCTASAYFALMRGGGEHYTLYLSRMLEELGHSVEIVCGREPWHQPQPLTDQFPIHYVTQLYYLREQAFKGIRYYGGAAWKVHTFQYDHALRSTLKRMRYDILHMHNPCTLGAAAWIRNRNKLPVVYTMHGPPSVRDKVHFRSLDHLMSVNQEIIDGLRMDGFQNVTLVPVGVDLDHFSPDKVVSSASSDSGPNLLFVGRLIPSKNVEGLLRAFKLIRIDHPQASLKIVGDGPLRRKLEAMANDMGTSVRFLGNVPWQMLPSHYRMADVFILPSFYESFSMVALEAASCGLPLAISSGAKAFLEDYGQKGAIMFDPHDPKKLAEAALLCIEPDQTKRMRSHALEVLPRYDWKSRARTVERVYLEVMER